MGRRAKSDRKSFGNVVLVPTVLSVSVGSFVFVYAAKQARRLGDYYQSASFSFFFSFAKRAAPRYQVPSPLVRLTMIVNNQSTSRRGTFIVFEGVDRCGKTTQCGLLVKHLLKLGLAAVAMRFPDRTTLVGNLINQYLQSKSELDDRAIHLLFSSNRWEVAPTLQKHLEEGRTVICDRYAYSGVAFSSAKPSLSEELSWCQACDVGLPAPDAVIFLDLTQEEAEKRGG